MMTLRSHIETIMILWLASIVACLVPLRWALFPSPRRFLPGIVLPSAALVGGILGMTHYRFIASTTIKGGAPRTFDSRNFFIVTVVLAVLSLAFTIWRRKRTGPARP